MIFIGHCYEHWNNGGDSRIDERIQKLDLSGYEVIMLGGDVTPKTFTDYKYLEHVNSIFNIESSTTLWAIGNHDYMNGNTDWYRSVTGRETFYTSSIHEITYFVYDASINPANCEKLNEQFELLTTVCDTISNSSQLIIIFHHGIWSNIPGVKNPNLIGHTHFPYYNANCNSSESTFKNAIYPMFVKLEEKNIDVTCIMGDAGGNGNKYAEESDDGVLFMASGINNSQYKNKPDELSTKLKDKLLEFKYNPQNNKLNYRFIDLDSMLTSQGY